MVQGCKRTLKLTTGAHTLCVLNPLAGSGVAQQRWPRVAALMESFGISYDLLAGTELSPGAQVFEQLQRVGVQAYAAIVGIGGDGTHSSVINALMNYRLKHPGSNLPPYAFIPLGTGNAIAKSFGLDSREDFFSNDLRRAVATIRYGADYSMDLGWLGHAWFASAMTIGLDSSILREYNRRKRLMARFPRLGHLLKGNLLYSWSASIRFWRQTPIAAQITVDGQPWYSGALINLVVNNTRVYAGEFILCPDAFANDGLLEVIAIAGRTDYLKKYLLAYWANPPRIQSLPERFQRVAAITRAQRVEVLLARAEVAQFDGEELSARRHFVVQVSPSALLVKIPAEPA